MRRTLGGLALAISCVLTSTACAVDGTPAPIASPRPPTGPEGTSIVPADQNPIPYKQLWDPCTLKPEYFDVLNFGRYSDPRPFNRPPTMKTCGFMGRYRTTSYAEGMKRLPSFGLNVISFAASFDEAFTNNTNEAVRPTTVGGRKAHLFGNKPFTVDESCTIAWGTSFGSIWVMVDVSGRDPLPSVVPVCHRLADIVWRNSVH